jgi:hypothetical protein
VLEAIAHPGKVVSFGSFDDTTIEDMEEAQGTNCVLYDGTYYEILPFIADPAPYGYLFLAIIGWLIVGIAAAVFARRGKAAKPSNS